MPIIRTQDYEGHHASKTKISIICALWLLQLPWNDGTAANRLAARELFVRAVCQTMVVAQGATPPTPM